MYSFKTLFRSDFPAPGDPFSFRCPNIFLYKNFLSSKVIRFNKATLLPQASGCHLNRFLRTLALGIFKGMSQSDSGGISENFIKVLTASDLDSYQKINEMMIKNMFHKRYESKTAKLENFNEQTFIPWIVLENPNVYQNWLS